MIRIMFVLMATLVAVPSPSQAESDRELVVLMLIDALRPDHMGAYGYKKPTTPFMDSLADSGTRFNRVYANAPWTRPSTASFLTGLNASVHQTETYKSKLPRDVRTLAQRVKKTGWEASAFVANGNGGSLAGLERGFDRFYDPTNAYTKKVRGKTYNGLPTGEFIVGETLKYLRASTAKKEFIFMFLVDPHDPYYAPPKLEKQFLGKHRGKIRRRALWERNNDYPESERRSMLAIYDAAIRYSDQAVEQFVDGLKKLGIWDRTHLLISADHGEGFGEHGFYLHAHHFWDEVVRIPLIAHGPEFAARVDDRLTDSLDIARTVLALTGASSHGLLGYSLLESAKPEKVVISEYNEFGIHRQAVVGPRFKVIWQRPADEAWYLREAKKKEFFPSVSFDKEVIRTFDLANDPHEKRELSATKTPTEAQQLLQKLRAFVEQS